MLRGLGACLAALAWIASAGALLSACQSRPAVPTLGEAVRDSQSLRLPYTVDRSGLIHVEVGVNGEGPFRLLLDTGATRTSLYRPVARRLGLQSTGAARVHGLVGEDIHETAAIDSLTLGAHDTGPQNVVVLPSRPDTVGDGILGMDILERHRIFLAADTREIVLLDRSRPEPVPPPEWGRIELEGNPWGRDSKGLRFLQLRVNGRLAPALLDTGSGVSVMSFEFADWPEVRNARRRMRENWELNGALDTFRPRVEVRGVDFRAGNRVWYDENFIIKDLDTLEVIGAAGEPFAIAGLNLFADASFYLDFEANLLVLPKVPHPREPLTGTLLGSRNGRSAANVTRIELATHNRSSRPSSR